ncbi:YtcA family lipoprotein [Methyloferula stellata]|uniref:YtcA family lipoprotein n=1 Tax=Methyloferula stellata TaxID=876270 RepID=UPI000364BFD2|nr:YtcA family lipoprotein [Methyloferula stellata]
MGKGAERKRRLSGLARGGAVGSVTALTGCNSAPSQSILGSYFPSWMICALIGLAATIVVRQLLVASGLSETLPAPVIVYLALATAFAFATWLIWLQ